MQPITALTTSLLALISTCSAASAFGFKLSHENVPKRLRSDQSVQPSIHESRSATHEKIDISLLSTLINDPFELFNEALKGIPDWTWTVHSTDLIITEGALLQGYRDGIALINASEPFGESVTGPLTGFMGVLDGNWHLETITLQENAGSTPDHWQEVILQSLHRQQGVILELWMALEAMVLQEQKDKTLLVINEILELIGNTTELYPVRVCSPQAEG